MDLQLERVRYRPLRPPATSAYGSRASLPGPGAQGTLTLGAVTGLSTVHQSWRPVIRDSRYQSQGRRGRGTLTAGRARDSTNPTPPSPLDKTPCEITGCCPPPLPRAPPQQPPNCAPCALGSDASQMN